MCPFTATCLFYVRAFQADAHQCYCHGVRHAHCPHFGSYSQDGRPYPFFLPPDYFDRASRL